MKRFVPFSASSILFEDEDVIAVSKPAGVPSQSPDERYVDDIVLRTRAFLATRDSVSEESVRLGVHQRLDEGTSGVMVFSKTKVGALTLQSAFEEHRVEKEYLAVVTRKAASRSGRAKTSAIETPLAKRNRGRVQASDRGRSAKTWIDELEVNRVTGARLLRCRIETGRTHQVRVHLSHDGTSIVGDALYGGDPWFRMALHARALAFPLPNGAVQRVECETDALFASAYVDDIRRADTTAKRLAKEILLHAAERRWSLAQSKDTNAFRLFHGEGEGLPGVDVDLYDTSAVLLIDEDLAHLETSFADAIEGLGFESVFVKRRPRSAARLGTESIAERVPAKPLRGVEQLGEHVVRERGLAFGVRLNEGFSTGLFTDQRESRRKLEERVEGKSFLNLFCYTGAFTVAAARAGCERSTSVDVSKKALDQLAKNLELNGLSNAAHSMIAQDVTRTLEYFVKNERTFDVIVFDPPTSSGAKKGAFRPTDYEPALVLAFRVLAKDGAMLVVTNDRRLPHDGFRALIHRAARTANRNLMKLSDLPPQRDYPAPLSGEDDRPSHVLSAWARV